MRFKVGALFYAREASERAESPNGPCIRVERHL